MKKISVLVCFLIIVILSLPSGSFKKEPVLDEFGDATKNFVIVSSKKLEGTFSNSSVTNSKMSYSIEVGDDRLDYVSFIIYENGKSKDLSIMSNKDDILTVKIKTDDGETYTFGGKIEPSASYNYNTVKVTMSLRDYFFKNTSLKVVISNDRGSYNLGTIDLTDFVGVVYDKTLYNKAQSLMEKGKNDEAIEVLKDLYNTDSPSFYWYKSDDLIKRIRKQMGGIIGTKGPAGGYIFYDCDADNNSGNKDGLISSECGWRYMEVTPNTISSDSYIQFVFGTYVVNGNSSMVGTSKEVGTGKENTEKLVKAMGNSLFISSWGVECPYAAKICSDLVYGGYDDWFLPSKGELDLIFDKFSGIQDKMTDYRVWSSSEENKDYAWLPYSGVMKKIEALSVYAVRRYK